MEHHTCALEFRSKTLRVRHHPPSRDPHHDVSAGRGYTLEHLSVGILQSSPQRWLGELLDLPDDWAENHRYWLLSTQRAHTRQRGIKHRFTVGNAKGAYTPQHGPDRTPVAGAAAPSVPQRRRFHRLHRWQNAPSRRVVQGIWFARHSRLHRGGTARRRCRRDAHRGSTSASRRGSCPAHSGPGE
jgi:hypothetical protein